MYATHEPVSNLLLEKEYRFSILSSDWFLLGRLFGVSDFVFQFDETWKVSDKPLKIARIRNESGNVTVCYKTVRSNSESLEEILDLSSGEARSIFDTKYQKDLTITKLRGVYPLKDDVVITLDLVDGVGHCIEIEGNNDRVKQKALSFLGLHPSQAMKGYGFYLVERVTPFPHSLALDTLSNLRDLT